MKFLSRYLNTVIFLSLMIAIIFGQDSILSYLFNHQDILMVSNIDYQTVSSQIYEFTTYTLILGLASFTAIQILFFKRMLSERLFETVMSVATMVLFSLFLVFASPILSSLIGNGFELALNSITAGIMAQMVYMIILMLMITLIVVSSLQDIRTSYEYYKIESK